MRAHAVAITTWSSTAVKFFSVRVQAKAAILLRVCFCSPDHFAAVELYVETG